MPEFSPLCIESPQLGVLDRALQIQSKMPGTPLPGDRAVLFPVDRSCRSSCNSVSSLEKAHQDNTAYCEQEMLYSLSDVQQVCQNLPVLLKVVPSKVNI